MANGKFRLLEAFRKTFAGTLYKHRNSTLGTPRRLLSPSNAQALQRLPSDEPLASGPDLVARESNRGSGGPTSDMSPLGRAG